MKKTNTNNENVQLKLKKSLAKIILYTKYEFKCSQACNNMPMILYKMLFIFRLKKAFFGDGNIHIINIHILSVIY